MLTHTVFVLWDLPGGVLAAPESALCGWLALRLLSLSSAKILGFRPNGRKRPPFTIVLRAFDNTVVIDYYTNGPLVISLNERPLQLSLSWAL